MEHLALEVFDLATKENPRPTGSQYAVLEPDATITITDTSEIFADGDVWSYDFTLNVHANAHLFGTAGDIHGSRLHEQINKRKARLWVEGTPLYLGYLKLGDEAEVDAEGNVDISFESGQKTFEEMIEGTSAQEVSVGDVVIGVALNRKRVTAHSDIGMNFVMDGLSAYAAKGLIPNEVVTDNQSFFIHTARDVTPFVQQWPKFVKSHGTVYDSSGNALTPTPDFTNIQSPYDAEHPFCNINICYPLKANKNGEDVVGRGYTVRLARDVHETTDGGDNQTRYNNAPNFYLLYFIDRLFNDLKINIAENQALDVEDLRRVFMLNYGCFYEELEGSYLSSTSHYTPSDKLERYGQYYLPIVDEGTEQRLLKDWSYASKAIKKDDYAGKILLRNVKVIRRNPDEHPAVDHETLLEVGSIECTITSVDGVLQGDEPKFELETYTVEKNRKAYSAYLAYATGENYPNVEISDIINAMKTMFGVRFIFGSDFKTVRIVLLRNVFRNEEVQDISCDIVDDDIKVENNKRGFRMTYGKGTEDTNFYYKGFNDAFPREATTWKNTSDKHDYSQWELNAEYGIVKQSTSAMNKTCYVTPVNGNAYLTKVDEEEDVLFPSTFEVGAFIDAEDGDCSGENETIEELQMGASPVIMNDVNNTYASLFSGDMKAPSPQDYNYAQKITTLGRFTKSSQSYDSWLYANLRNYKITGDLDAFIGEGFQIRMEDNYSISNGGTPFDEANPGLQFGIMRSSGSNAHVRYFDDPDDDENGELDTWEIVPGDGAIDHPDTCDSYGNEWMYSDGIRGAGNILKKIGIDPSFVSRWRVCDPDTLDIGTYGFYPPYNSGGSYANIFCQDNVVIGERHVMVTPICSDGEILTYNQYNSYVDELKRIYSTTDSALSYDERMRIVKAADYLDLLVSWSGNYPEDVFYKVWNYVLDNVAPASSLGAISLKLRAEKPNPYFDPKQPESDSNRRYLQITNKNLRQRGLADQFYKEYSYWIRNARIVKRTVRMTLAQLLTIDKTKRVRVGDVTGFIRKMQYSVSNETGLGNVVMEIMYI